MQANSQKVTSPFIKALQAALISLIFFAVSGFVQAQGSNNWNLYGNTISEFVPFLNSTPLTSGTTPTLSLQVGTGSVLVGANSPMSFAMDTGSTGIAISSNLYNPGNDKYIAPGATRYSSSGLQYNGNVYQTTVNINGVGGAVVATSVVDVLVVTSATCYKYQATYCPNGINGPPVGVSTTNIHYAGIGFAAGNGFMNSAIAASATNPFTNISTIGGQAVTSSNYAQGYVITQNGAPGSIGGVNLGLTSNNTSNFAYVKLGAQPGQSDPALWARAAALVTTSVTIPGGSSTVSGSGQILTDSGVGEMIISPAVGSGLVAGATPNPGTVITVNLGGQSGTQNYYSFTVGGNTGTPQIAPTTIEVAADTGIFVNTGRLFLNGFNYLYDSTNGFVGYSWTNAVSGVSGQTTPSIQFQCDIGCNFYMPDGFSTNLPTWLGSNTTFTTLGLATLSGVISGSANLTVDGSGSLELSGQNTYTGTTTINSGSTLALSGLGSIATSSGVTNNGTFDISAASSNISVQSYAQGSTGKLVMAIAPGVFQQLSIAGKASLAGSLVVTAGLGNYVAGKYSLLNAAGGVTGTFSSFSTNLALATNLFYDANNVYLTVYPFTTADTQQSLVNTSQALQNTYTLQNAALANGFTYDCNLFDVNNICVSAGGHNTAVQAANGLNTTSALLIASYRLDENNSRVGAYADQNLSVNNAGSTVNLGNNTPLIGVFGAWSQHPDGMGAEVKAGVAFGQKNTTITRQIVGTSEPGSGSSQLNSQGAQVTAKYGFGVMENVIVSPYVGMRYTQNNMGGYSEAASATVTSPLTYSALNTNATTALAGVGASYRFIPKSTVFASAGVESDTNTANGNYAATGLTGLTPINFNANPVKTRPTATIGATYDVEKNQRIGIAGIYRQEPFQAVSTTTVMATYTVGL